MGSDAGEGFEARARPVLLRNAVHLASPDPLLASGRAARPQSWNRYAYALNNPLRLTDPSGLIDTPTEGQQQPPSTSDNPPPAPPAPTVGFMWDVIVEPDVFLSNLVGTPPAVRQKIYSLLDGWELSDQDRRAIKAYLKSVAKTSDAAPLADELLKALPPPPK